VVWISTGEKHLARRLADQRHDHLAMQEQVDGSAVTWMEHVTDAEYGREVDSVPRMLRSAPRLRRGALLSGGPSSLREE